MKLSLLIGVLALLVLITGARPSLAAIEPGGTCEVAWTYDGDGDGICFGDPSNAGLTNYEAAQGPLAAISPTAFARSMIIERISVSSSAVRPPPRFVSPELRPPNRAAL